MTNKHHMSRKQAIAEVGRMKAVNQMLSIDIVEKDAEIDRLRKALEEIKGITGIGYESAYRQAVEIATQALEPAKGEDTQ